MIGPNVSTTAKRTEKEEIKIAHSSKLKHPKIGDNQFVETHGIPQYRQKEKNQDMQLSQF